jgi:hypothetical protein
MSIQERPMERQQLIKKIEELPPDQLAEVEKLVESMASDDRQSDRNGLHQALAEYAAQHAGSATDLDQELESAGIEALLQHNSQQ